MGSSEFSIAEYLCGKHLVFAFQEKLSSAILNSADVAKNVSQNWKLDIGFYVKQEQIEFIWKFQNKKLHSRESTLTRGQEVEKLQKKLHVSNGDRHRPVGCGPAEMLGPPAAD